MRQKKLCASIKTKTRNSDQYEWRNSGDVGKEEQAFGQRIYITENKGK